MGLNVNIGEAKDRLSQLIAAAKRGEDVVISRAGRPEIRLVPVDPDAARNALAAKRRAFIGSVPKPEGSDDIDWFAPMSEEELAQWYGGPVFPGGDAASS